MRFKTSPKEDLRRVSCVSNKIDYRFDIRWNIFIVIHHISYCDELKSVYKSINSSSIGLIVAF